MTQTPMTLAERISKISGLAVLADASRRLGDVAHSFALNQAHRRAQRDATGQLLALIVSPEGQAALRWMEELAGGDLGHHQTETVSRQAPFGPLDEAVDPTLPMDYLGGSIWSM